MEEWAKKARSIQCTGKRVRRIIPNPSTPVVKLRPSNLIIRSTLGRDDFLALELRVEQPRGVEVKAFEAGIGLEIGGGLVFNNDQGNFLRATSLSFRTLDEDGRLLNHLIIDWILGLIAFGVKEIPLESGEGIEKESKNC